MQLKIIKGDISTIECDAIVCSTSLNLSPMGQIDTVIHQKAGIDFTKFCTKVIGHCDTGKCVVTNGYNLPCKYVIHTVSPFSHVDSAAHILANCYREAIEQAIYKECSSVAFPLLGSGGKGFTVKKAIDVALNCFEVCMRNENRNITIFFVLFDDEAKDMAIARAKEIIQPQYLELDLESSDKSVLDKRWISLCKVNRPDKNNNIWMWRIADSINGTLIIPAFDENKEQISDNRFFIFHEDGPSTADIIGFWEWKERKTEDGRWHSDSRYIDQETPIEIYIMDTLSTVTEVVDLLRSGIHIPAYLRNRVLFAIQKDTTIEGVLCDLSDFNCRPGNEVYISLKSNIYTLPYYQINEYDILTWKNRKIYKQITLSESTKKIPVIVLSDTIKRLLLESMQWRTCKAQGVRRADWQKIKQVIQDIPNGSIAEKISASYHMSLQEAQDCIDQFLQSVDNYIDVTDVDSALIVQMLNNHSGLKETLDRIAAAKWHEEHSIEIQKANEEVSAILSNAEHEIERAKQNLLEVQKSISTAEEQRQVVLDDIACAQKQLSEIQAEIEKNTALGNDTVIAVREKIADAQKDMASFIADLSAFLPQPSASQPSRNVTKLWKYDCAPKDIFSEDDIELAYTWSDEYNAFSQNLTHSLSIESSFGSMLAAYLYSAHINNVPLLIAGPGGTDIANALSVSLYAENAGHLTLGNECDYNIIDEMRKYSEPVISIGNMFGKGWADTLPQEFTHLSKQIIWTHPTVEDLIIEPKGLYNYMLPVLSESFIGMLPAQNPWPGKRPQNNFGEYVSHARKPLKLSAFKRLGLSRLLLNKLNLVLCDAKELLGNPSADKDIEVLLGLLPLCVVTGRIDILKEVIETESGISSAVKAEAARYIEEA